MKIGDKVRHRNYPLELMQIKSISETVATCNYIERPKIWNMAQQCNQYETCICASGNLEGSDGSPVKEQLNLF